MLLALPTGRIPAYNQYTESLIMKRARFFLFPALAALAAAIAATPVAAQKLYKYTDSEGRVRYTDRPPIDMTGKAHEQLNSQGTVVKRKNAALTPEEIAAQEEERKRKAEQDAIAREEKRKNLALLATYPSMQDLEDAHARALANNAEASRQVEVRIAELKRRHKTLTDEAEKLQQAKKPVPAQLKRDLFDVESDMRAQSELLEVKKKEVELINARYGEDKRRYAELTHQQGASKTASTAPAPAAAPKR